MTIAVDLVDGLSSSVAVKGPAKAATTANVTLSGEQTINAIACVDGDRVLVKDQTTASECGIYVVSSGDWERAKDFSRNDDVVEGTQVYVTDGTNAGLWVLTTADPIVIGTSSIAFSNINTLVSGALLSANALSELAGAVAGFDNLSLYSSTSLAPAAGVLDLSAATSPFCALGSGAITSVTLGTSKWRLARADTTAETSITTAATLIVDGISSGVVRSIPRGSILLFVKISSTVTHVYRLGGGFAKGADVASAATIVLQNNATQHVTGSTGPITDIDFANAADGAMAWVIFDSTPTITHHSTTLKLPGGASITAAAGDRALFIQDSSDNVICLDYVRADGTAAAKSGQLLAKFFPTDNEPPSSNYAVFGTRNAHPYLAFDTTTAYAAVFSDRMPDAYAGGGITVTVFYMAASATSGTIGWTVEIERMNASSLDLDADSFATAATIVAQTVPGTTGQIMSGSIAITSGANMDSLAAGENYRIRIKRDVSNDTAAGDAQIVEVHVRET